MRIAILADSAVAEGVHRAARQALVLAAADLGFSATVPRTLHWFELDDGHNAESFSRHLLGYLDNPRAISELGGVNGRLRGFVAARFGEHGRLWIRRTSDEAQTASTVLHEAFHSHQVGQAWDGVSGTQAEAEAQAYAARMLPLVRISRATSWDEQRAARQLSSQGVFR